MPQYILPKKRADFFREFSGDKMWEISINQQLLSFFIAIIAGIGFCFIYDILKSLRLTFDFSSVSVFLGDILYSVKISVLAFLLFLSLSNGEIRSYILFGLGLGFIVSRFTVSHLTVFLLTKAFKLIKKFFMFLNLKITAFFDVLATFLLKMLSFLKNSKNLLKKLLKKDNGLLYTKQE